MWIVIIGPFGLNYFVRIIYRTFRDIYSLIYSFCLVKILCFYRQNINLIFRFYWNSDSIFEGNADISYVILPNFIHFGAFISQFHGILINSPVDND